jgi:alkanesulfonate monooxygenase SsuD/methylene tetrahydromethanopterin reductase-like flavin-dependent oxidoreductase (luciferase family)
VKFWNALTWMEPREAIEMAVLSEEVGYDGVCVADHLFSPRELKSKYPYSPDGTPRFKPDDPWPDPWVTIGAMAAVTKRLRFTTNIYIAPARDVFTVAKLVSTAACISENRVSLGMGMGWMREEFELTGQDLWAGGYVEHHGTYYDFDALRIDPVPAEPVPILIGGDSSAAIRRATQLADGWIGLDYSVEDAEALVKRILERRADGPRADEPFELILALKGPLDSALCEHFEALGVTSFMVAPAMFTRDRTPEGRAVAVRRFADAVIATVN